MVLNTFDETNNKRIFKCYFDSINDLLSAVETRPINTEIFDPVNLNSERPGPNYLNKTKDLQEAINLCRYGVSKEELRNFIDLNDYMENILPNFMQKRNIIHNMYGYRPDVYKFLNGNPKSMYQLKRKTPKKSINILMLPNFYGKHIGSVIINLGVSVIQLVKLLEMAGYSVSIYYLDVSRQWDKSDDSLNRKEEFFLYEVLIKDNNQKINPVASYFPMCHPDFTRRLIFRITETLPFSLKEWSSDYGMTVSDINSYMNYFESYNNSDKKIIIDKDIVDNTKGKDIIKDFSNLLDKINFESYLVEDQKKEYSEKIKKLKRKGE